jgi:hypothetical protein
MIAPVTTSNKRRLVTAVSVAACALGLLFAAMTDGSAQLRHMPGGGGLKGGGLGSPLGGGAVVWAVLEAGGRKAVVWGVSEAAVRICLVPAV